MKSKWINKKADAIKLRRRGYSLRKVEAETGIPRSTLSGWFRHVSLSPTYVRRLEGNRLEGLKRARSLASAWHKEQKKLRQARAQRNAEDIVEALDLTDIKILKVILAGLYMGEGAKRDGDLVLASSNPVIVKFYVAALCKAYNITRKNFKSELQIRSDQNGQELMKFWLNTLHLPNSSMGSIHKDPRTRLKKTWPGYKGVCLVSGGGSAVQRELLYLGGALFEHSAK